MKKLPDTMKRVETLLNQNLKGSVKKVVVNWTKKMSFVFIVHLKNGSYNLEFDKKKKFRVWNSNNSYEKELELLKKEVKYFTTGVLEDYYEDPDKIVYAKTNTYKFDLDFDEDNPRELVKITNRRKSQTLFLFQLVDGDFKKLVNLEKAIKETNTSYCPMNKKEVGNILMKYFKNKSKSNSDFWNEKFKVFNQNDKV